MPTCLDQTTIAAEHRVCDARFAIAQQKIARLESTLAATIERNADLRDCLAEFVYAAKKLLDAEHGTDRQQIAFEHDNGVSAEAASHVAKVFLAQYYAIARQLISNTGDA